MFWLIFLKMKYVNFFKNGCYLDFSLKLVLKKFVYNIFIFLGFFFAEKYMIEWNTKYMYVYLIYNFSNFFKNLTNHNMYLYLIFFTINIAIFSI